MLSHTKTDNQHKLARRKHETIAKTIVKNKGSMLMHIQSQNAKSRQANRQKIMHDVYENMIQNAKFRKTRKAVSLILQFLNENK